MAESATGGGGALINLGDLSRPATVLIEKISDAVGGIAKPWQIVRTATAEAKAEIIHAQARIQISEIEQRALIRMVREEGQKQENIENITAKAIPKLSPDTKPDGIENDWLAHFFDRCRLTSDEEMQSLWANILAGQANKPGSFSKRTIDLVATLDKSDAEMFTKFCTFIWVKGDDELSCPIIENVNDEIFKKLEINFTMLNHLDNIGLINYTLLGIKLEQIPKIFTLSYYDASINIEFPQENDNRLDVGKILLTRTGQELASICGSVRSEEYFMYTLESWIQKGYFLTSPLLDR